jgi:hypothetical protein
VYYFRGTLQIADGGREIRIYVERSQAVWNWNCIEVVQPFRSVSLNSLSLPRLLFSSPSNFFDFFTTLNLTAFAEDFSGEREDFYVYHIKDLSYVQFRF